METILVTGCAGFIGMHCTQELLARGYQVVGVDNVLNLDLKNIQWPRLKCLLEYRNFVYKDVDIDNHEDMKDLVLETQPTYILHLQTAWNLGVKDYNSFYTLLQASLFSEKLEHIVFASSAIVYSLQSDYGSVQKENVLLGKPVNSYANTKVNQENLAYVFAQQHRVQVTGMRYFNVHGPWMSPGGFLSIVLDKLYKKKLLAIRGKGLLVRDFVHVYDAAIATALIIQNTQRISDVPYFRVYNVGTGFGTTLNQYVREIESLTGIKLKKSFLPETNHDIRASVADVENLKVHTEFVPKRSVKIALTHALQWHNTFQRFK